MGSLAWLSHVLRSQYTHLPYPDYSFAGQTVIVTGANVGLGFEAASHYVRLGAKKLIIAVRNLDKGEDAKKEIERRTGRRDVIEVWQLDLSSYESVKSFARQAESLDRIDILLENAGMVASTWQTAEGSELTMTVNVYGTFLLALSIYPLMQKTAKTHNVLTRLSVVSSDTHHYAEFKETEQDDMVAMLDDKRFFQPGEPRYALSKLIELYYVREFCNRVNAESKGVVMNVVNPGLCWSGLARNAPWLYAVQIFIFRVLLARSTEAGSRTLVSATTGGVESHGMYSVDCTFNDNAVGRFVRSDQGKKVQEKVFDQINKKLENIEPGILKGIPVS